MAAGLRTWTGCLLLASVCLAQQTVFTNSGGTISLGTDLVISGSTIGSPAGTLALSCPVTALPPGPTQAEWVCNGGTISIQSTDGLTSVNGSLTSGTVIETAAGGGRGGHITYYYSFTGSFVGTMTVNGQAQAVMGSTSQVAAPSQSELGTGALSGGTSTVNAQYEPLYITDTYNYRVVRIDDMFGDNMVTLGTYGSGTRQFGLPWGLALDSAGRIYVTDSANCRVARMDNMSGKNWTTLGQCGPGNLQFNSPGGIFVAASGAIYVADSGNNRIVRMNDMSGSQWTTFGAPGSGTGQFSQPAAIVVDSAHRIYVADNGNARIVRMDDFTGTNWTTLGGPGSGTNQFASPYSLWLDTSGRIYVADTYNNRVVRMDDMAGTNWTVLGGTLGSGVAQFINPYGASVDPSGTIYIADSRAYRIDMSDDMVGTGWMTYGSGSQPVFDSPTTIVPAPPASPVAVSVLSASSLTYPNTVVGTSSASQSITLTNIGSAPLDINGITPSGDFAQTNTCGSSVTAGQSCTLSITFTPTAGGVRAGSITLSFATGSPRKINLSGLGTLVSVSPLSLNFGNVNAGGRGASLTVTVANPGTAPAPIASILLKAPPVYRLQNPCPATLAAGASCMLTVKFFPQAAQIYYGALTVTDGTGTGQKVTITGTGISN